MTVPDGGGVLLVDKPPGPTSHDVIQLVRRALKIRKVGHTGTLDPFASGLLLVCVGPATRLSEYLVGLEKTYEAVARLGVSTDTLDREGRVTEEREGWKGITPDEMKEALSGLRGEILQVPPQYSAKKVDGESMHRKARRGERVTLDPVPVTVHELDLVELDLPEVRIRIRCSSGTYIRALARDLGSALDTGAHLVELRRTAVGEFRVDVALSPDALEDSSRLQRSWISPARALSHLPGQRVEAEEAARISHGQGIAAADVEIPEGTPIAVLSGDALLAVAEREGLRLRPRKVFAGA